MKLVKKGLRIWLTIASVFSFLAGWVLLAHANKPAPLQFDPPSISATVPRQVSSPSNDFSSGGFPFAGQFQSPSFSPRLRTGGS